MHAISYILLAQPSRGDSFREGFRSRGTSGHDDVLLGLLIVAALVAGMWAISRLVGLRRQRRGYNNPWRLFWALCKAHRLNWSDSWLLRRVARDQNLHDPGRLFLEEERWEKSNLGPRFALENPRLKALRKRIFGAAAEGPMVGPTLTARACRRPGRAAAVSQSAQPDARHAALDGGEVTGRGMASTVADPGRHHSPWLRAFGDGTTVAVPLLLAVGTFRRGAALGAGCAGLRRAGGPADVAGRPRAAAESLHRTRLLIIHLLLELVELHDLDVVALGVARISPLWATKFCSELLSGTGPTTR